MEVLSVLGQFTRNYTQTVKRTADNKIKAEHQAQESARCSACFVVRGFQRGLPLGTLLCNAKCSVLYALSALPWRAREFEAAGKQGCDCVAKSRKRWTVFISRQGVYESPHPSSHASTCGQRFSLDYPLAKTGGTVNGGVSSLKRRSARSAFG